MPDYIDLLQSQEWKEKRNEIFERDNWHCQRCGIKKKERWQTILYNMSNEFIESLDSIKLRPSSTLKVNVLELKKNNFEICCKTYIGEINTGQNIEFGIILNFVKPSKISYPFQGSILKNTPENIFHKENTNNFIKSRLKENGTTNSQKGLDLEGIWFIQKKKESDFTKQGSYLEVHHKCYRSDIQIWDQKDEEYISLCNICHRIVHESTDIPFFDSNGLDYRFRKACSRCNGLRFFTHYNHIQNGRCFKCGGLGYY